MTAQEALTYMQQTDCDVLLDHYCFRWNKSDQVVTLGFVGEIKHREIMDPELFLFKHELSTLTPAK